jgi:hypothetical protein
MIKERRASNNINQLLEITDKVNPLKFQVIKTPVQWLIPVFAFLLT